MEETLIIKNFGPIESVELKLKRFTILIGEQATGKSTVAKVLAVCRYFSYIVSSNFTFSEEFEFGLASWGLMEFIQDDSFICYESHHYSLIIQKKLVEVASNFGGKIYRRNGNVFKPEVKSRSKQFDNLLNEYEKVKPQPQNEDDLFEALNWRIPTSFFQNDVSRVMDNPFYIPTERGLQSIFSLGRNSIQNISDSLFNQFAKLDQIVKHFKESTLIEPLDIAYKNDNGKGLIKKNNQEKYYSLANGASGYQSTIPVVLTVEYYSTIRKKSKTFIIEEPELNLFPLAQNELMKYLVNKSMIHNHQILLTTHSPYIIISLNNLLYAREVGQDYSQEIDAIVQKKYWLNPDEVSAYRLLPDGTAKNIVDYELHQIDVGEIDEASRELNGTWDKISDVKYSSVGQN